MFRNVILVAASVSMAAAPAFARPASAAEQKAKENRDLAKIVDGWNQAKAAGPLSSSKCNSLAKDFEGFADDYKAPEGYFDAGVVRESCGDTRGAEDEYNRALSINSRFAPARANLGSIAYRAGDFSTAQQDFDQALRDDPKNVTAYNGSAMLLFDRYRQTGDQNALKNAVLQLRRALAVDADSIAAYAQLAMIYYTTAQSDPSKLDLAKLVCDQAKEVNDKYPQIYNTLGLIMLQKKNVTGALKEFRTAVQYDPHYIEANLNIGAITLSVRDYTSAEQAFRAVLDAKPRDRSQLFDATVGLGVALRGQRRIDEAEKAYAQAKAIDPRNCAISYNLGVLYQDYKNSDDAALHKARDFLSEFASCSGAVADKVKDAQQRVADIDKTFKVLAEQRRIQEEAEKLQKQMEQQQHQAQPPPGAAPSPQGAPPPPAAKGASAARPK